jgi:hypothetical protein
MTTQTAATTAHTSIVVQAPIERAFNVFTKDFGQIKPREHNLLGVEIAEAVFEPRVGGYLLTVGKTAASVAGPECSLTSRRTVAEPFRLG